MTELVEGTKYLVGIPPWGLQIVVYLGLALWPGYARVQNPITRRVVWVKTELIRPYLTAVKT